MARFANQASQKNPLAFLHDWLAIRRKGQEFLHTPMGFVCQDKPLTANHPFFHQHNDEDESISGDIGATKGWNPDEYTKENEEDAVYDNGEFFDVKEDLDGEEDGDEDGVFEDA